MHCLCQMSNETFAPPQYDRIKKKKRVSHPERPLAQLCPSGNKGDATVSYKRER